MMTPLGLSGGFQYTSKLYESLLSIVIFVGVSGADMNNKVVSYDMIVYFSQIKLPSSEVSSCRHVSVLFAIVVCRSTQQLYI